MASTWPNTAGAAALARSYRADQADPREVVEEHIARIDTWNPTLNAVVAHRFERARAEAEAAAAALREPGPHPPLLGVPVTIKEFLRVEGMPNTAGLAVRRGTIADDDAVTVARLRAAGAIVLGVTNGPEGGLWAETTNKVYGRTNNPWDPTHTCGGSSGGEAAILAVGGAALGLGSDIGGSVRIPAGWSGICAHKPTGRLVPTHGHTPANPSPYLCVGPMAPRVADLALALPILAGPHPDDPTAVAMPLGDPAAIRPDQLTVLLPEEPLRQSTADVVAATEAAATALADAGATVERVSLPPLAHAFNIWLSAMATAGFPSYAEVLGDGEPAPILSELVQALVGGGRHTIPPLLVSLTETLSARLPLVDKQAHLARRDQLAAELDQRLGPQTALLVPTTPRAAPRHNGLLLHFSSTGLCGVFNVLELPSTQVPAGTSGGLPVGVQLVGGKGMDHVCLAAASVVEAATGGWRPPERPS